MTELSEYAASLRTQNPVHYTAGLQRGERQGLLLCLGCCSMDQAELYQRGRWELCLILFWTN